MQTKQKRHILSSFFCMALIVAMALFATGCNGSQENSPSGTAQQTNDGQQTTAAQLGEGSIKFDFTVVDKEGNQTAFEIHTDKETVGQALLELELIAGDEGPYGLYVKTVNGITADFDKDGVYWAFYINGEYAVTSVDGTKITEGDHYSFQME